MKMTMGKRRPKYTRLSKQHRRGKSYSAREMNWMLKSVKLNVK